MGPVWFAAGPQAAGRPRGCRSMVPGKARLGEILVRAGEITPAQLQKALDYQRTAGCRLGTALQDLRFCSDAAVARVLAEQLDLPFVDLDSLVPSPQCLARIPR